MAHPRGREASPFREGVGRWRADRVWRPRDGVPGADWPLSSGPPSGGVGPFEEPGGLAPGTRSRRQQGACRTRQRPSLSLLATFADCSERPTPPTPRLRKELPGKTLREGIKRVRRTAGSELPTPNLWILRTGHTRCVYLSFAWIDESRCLETALIPCPSSLTRARPVARRRHLTRAASSAISARI